MAEFQTLLKPVHDREEISCLQNAVLHAVMNAPVLDRLPYYKRQTLPGSQPKSFKRRDFKKILEDEYWVCSKTDGHRFILFCHPEEDESLFSGKCFMLDRGFRPFELLGITPWKNKFVILDGELLINMSTPVFKVFDCVMANGIHVADKNTSERLRMAAVCASLWNENFAKMSPPIIVEVKQFVMSSDIRSIFDEIREIPCEDNIRTIYTLRDRHGTHAVDGIVFTPETAPYDMKSGQSTLKWKWKEFVTFDFATCLNRQTTSSSHGSPITVPLKVVANHDMYLEVGRMEITEETLALFRRTEDEMKMMQHSDSKSTVYFIVECTYNVRNGGWCFWKVRNDRSRPNYFDIFVESLQTLIENVTKEEIISTLGKQEPPTHLFFMGLENDRVSRMSNFFFG